MKTNVIKTKHSARPKFYLPAGTIVLVRYDKRLVKLSEETRAVARFDNITRGTVFEIKSGELSGKTVMRLS